MATLNTKLLRQDVVARLDAAATVVATVFDSKSTPMTLANLPAVSVYSPTTTLDRAGIGAPIFRNIDLLKIEIHIRDDTDDGSAAAAANDLEEAVLDALFTDPLWVKQTEMTVGATITRGVDTASDVRRAVSSIQLRSQYRRQFRAPMTDLLKTVHVDIDMIQPGDGPDGDIDTAQTIEGLDA